MKIVHLQKHVRGYLCRKHLRQSKDHMTFSIVAELLKKHISHYYDIVALNNQLKKKRIRHVNFPSEVSENIVKFVLYRKYRIMPTWDTDWGDLQCANLMIEVKAFSSTGPTSFGPTEKWDRIYFLDARGFIHSFFKVYECRLKNTDPVWQRLRVNKTETYGDQCQQKRRPRLCFHDLKEQLGRHCTLLFEGRFDQVMTEPKATEE